jgi:hypothetical protein
MPVRFRWWAATSLFLLLLLSRLCHLRVLWTEEAYPSAAALQLLYGKTLYLGVWYDKPPLAALLYLLWGAHTGLALRLADTLILSLAAALAWRLARDLWGEPEAWLAAALLVFFLVFDLPASVIVLGPDLLMLAPHLAAVWLAIRRRPLSSGLAAGLAFLLNTKGAFVLLACLVFYPSAWLPLLAGFALPNALALATIAWTGALHAYWLQVWQWGFLYARDTPIAHPLREAILRTLDWSGFHAALLIGAALYFSRSAGRQRLQSAAWSLLSFAAVAGGWRFFPRYYFQILPVAVLLGARGLAQLRPRLRTLALLTLLLPAIRFGPRYAFLAADLFQGATPRWSDLNLSQDALAAASILQHNAKPGDTLLVWGYRPEIFAATRLQAATPFLDSQPLTGVIADRHLTDSHPSAPALAAANRRILARSAPTFLADGLGPLNPALAITQYPDLAPWLSHYHVFARTPMTVLYRRTDSAPPVPR